MKTVSDLVQMFVAANIPFNVADNLTSDIISRKTFEVAEPYPEVMFRIITLPKFLPWKKIV